MTAQELWEEYSRLNRIDADYDAWAFGDDPDELARLVNAGIKTATASGALWYDLEGEELPKAGQYSVILNSREEAVCIIQTTRVFTVPFNQVDEMQAWREGEGDRSLHYWRRVHERFFTEELKTIGRAFDENMLIVCEEFQKVYP